MKGVTNYLKNVTKSVMYFSADVVKSDLMPNTSDFLESNKEPFVEAYAAVTHPKQSTLKLTKSVRESKYYEAIDYGAKNLFEDLRTGKFYNKERDASKYAGSAFNLDDFNDLSEFGVYGGFEDIDKQEITDNVTSGDMKVVEAIEGSNQAAANATINAIAEVSEKSIKNSRVNTGILYAQNEKLFQGAHNDISVLNATLDSMFKVTAKVLPNMDNNMSDYFSKSLKLEKENNAILKEMLEIQRNVYKSAVDREKEENEKKKKNIRYGDLVGSGGMPNIKEYINLVNQNIKKQMQNSGFDVMNMMGDDSNTLAVMLSNPWELILGGAFKSLVPATVKLASKELDKTISSVFGQAMGKLANAREKDGIGRIIAKFLGVDTSVDRTIKASKYEKGVVPFDGITRKAIVEVIPTYLRRIEAILSGREENIFDYDTGRFITEKSLKDKYDNIKKNAVKSSTQDIYDLMQPGINYAKKGMSRSDAKDFEKAVEQFREYLYDKNGVFNPKASAAKNGIDRYEAGGRYKDLADDRFYEILRTIFDSMDFDNRTGRHRKLSEKLRISNSVMEAKDRERRMYEDLQRGGYSALVQYKDSGLKYNQNGKFDDNGKFSSNSTNTLLNTKDSLGNTLFTYLQKISAELQWQRLYGSSKNGSKYYKRKSTSLANSESQIKSIMSGLQDPNLINDSINKNKREIELNESADRSRESSIAKRTGIDFDLLESNPEEYVTQLATMVATKATKMYDDELKDLNKGFIARAINYDPEDKESVKDKKAIEDAVDKVSEKTGVGRLLDRVNGIKDRFNSITKAPAEIFTNLLYAADRSIYDMMFRAEVVDKDGNTSEGFLNLLADKTVDIMDKISNKFKENILDPLKKRLGLDDLVSKTKDQFKTLGGTIVKSFIDANKEVYKPIYDSAKKAMSDKPASNSIQNAINKLNDTLSPTAKPTDKVQDALNSKLEGPQTLKDQLKAEVNDKLKGKSPRDELKDWAKDNLKDNNAYGTPTGKPFSGVSMLSKGELLFNSRGTSVVNKTGMYNVSEPTHILNSYDSNPILKSMGINMGPRRTPEQDLAEENRVKNKIFNHAKGTEITDANGKPITGGSSGTVNTDDVKDALKKYAPEGLAGGAIGGLASMLLGVVGGPLIGAAIGAGANIVRNSSKLKDKLFGPIGEDGKREGGSLLNKRVMGAINKYGGDMKKYGLAGIIPGLLTPLGPLGGILVGSTIGYLKNNESFMDKYFGEKDEDGKRSGGKLNIGKKEQDIIKKMLPNAGKGALAGAGISLLFGGPFGLLGNAAVGSAVGMMTSTDEFKEGILGKTINGVREGGVLSILEQAFEPLLDAGEAIKTKIINAIDENFVDPLSRFITPAIHKLGRGAAMIPKMLNRVFEDKIAKPITERLKILVSGSKLLGGIGKLGAGAFNIATKPFKLVGSLGDRWRTKDIEKGRADYMTAQERIDFLNGKGKEGTELDKALADIGKEGSKFSLNDAENMLNNLTAVTTSNRKLTSSLDAQSRKIMSKFEKWRGYDNAKITPNALKSIRIALQSKNIEEVNNVLQTYTLSNKRMMTPEERQSIMNGETKLNADIKQYLNLSKAKQVAGKMNKRDKDSLQGDLEKQIEEKFGIKIKGTEDLNRFKSLLNTEVINAKANPRNEEKALYPEATEKLGSIDKTLTTIAGLVSAFANGDEKALKGFTKMAEEIVNKAEEKAQEEDDKILDEAIEESGVEDTDAAMRYSEGRNGASGGKIHRTIDTILNHTVFRENKYLKAFKNGVLNEDKLNALEGAVSKKTLKLLNKLKVVRLDVDAAKEFNNLDEVMQAEVQAFLSQKKLAKFLSGRDINKDDIQAISSARKPSLDTCFQKCYRLQEAKKTLNDFESLQVVFDMSFNEIEQIMQEAGVINESTNRVDKIKRKISESIDGARSIYHGLKGAKFYNNDSVNAVKNAATDLGNRVIDKIKNNKTAKSAKDFGAKIIDNLKIKNPIYDMNEDDAIDVTDESNVANNGIGTFLLGAAKTGLSLGKKVVGGAKKAVGIARNAINAVMHPIESIKGALSNTMQNIGFSGNTVTNPENGDTMKMKQDSDGSVSPDTSDSKTKDILNKASKKEQMLQKLQEAQLKAAEVTSDMLGEEKEGKKGNKWLQLLLTGLIAAPFIKKILDSVAKPLWDNFLAPKLKSIGNWVLDTAVPAVGKLIGNIVGVAIKSLPKLIISALKGIKNFAGGVLDGVTGNKNNAGAETSLNTEGKDENELSNITDKDGNRLTYGQIASGEYNDNMYNEQGAKATVGEDGSITFKDQSKSGSSFAEKITKGTGRMLIKGKTGRLIGGLDKAATFMLKRKNIFAKGIGVAGKAITKPLKFAANPLKAIIDAGDKVVTKSGNIGEKTLKLIDGCKEALSKLFGDSKVGARLAKVADSLGIKNVDEWVIKIHSKIDDIFSKFIKESAEKVEKSALSQAFSKVTKLLGPVMVVADFLTGCDKAESILGVKDTGIVEEFVSGIVNAICNLTVILSIVPGVGPIASEIMKLFVDDKEFEKRQKEADDEVAKYNEENGTTYSKEEYLSRNKSFTGKIGGKIKGVAGKAWGGIKKVGSSIAGFFKGKSSNEQPVSNNAFGTMPSLAMAGGYGIQQLSPYDNISNNISNLIMQMSGVNTTNDEIINKAKSGEISIFSPDYWAGAVSSKEGLVGNIETTYNGITRIMQIPLIMVSKIFGGFGNWIRNLTGSIGDKFKSLSKFFNGDASNSSSVQSASAPASNSNIGSTATTTDSSTANNSSGNGFFSKLWSGVKSIFGMGKYGKGYDKQNDPSIANIRYNAPGDTEYQTIGDSGCGPAAAVSAVRSAYGRGTNDIVSAAKYALDGGYKETNGGTRPEFFMDYFNQNGLGSKLSNNRDELADRIASGQPTVLMGQDSNGVNSNNPFGENPHYVTATGTDGNGNVIIQDPESEYDNQLYNMDEVISKSTLGVSAFGKFGRSKFSKGNAGNEKILAAAKEISNTLVSEGWHYGSSKSTFNAAKKTKGVSCGAFVSWVMQKAGYLKNATWICHTARGKGPGKSAVLGANNLINCKIMYPNKKYNKCNLIPGDVLIYDSNICVYAGGDKFYDAGGPFIGVNTNKSKKYTKILCSPGYDKSHNVYAVIRPKDASSNVSAVSDSGNTNTTTSGTTTTSSDVTAPIPNSTITPSTTTSNGGMLGSTRVGKALNAFTDLITGAAAMTSDGNTPVQSGMGKYGKGHKYNNRRKSIYGRSTHNGPKIVDTKNPIIEEVRPVVKIPKYGMAKNTTTNSTGSSPFTTYQLSEDQLTKLARLCKQEQGTNKGIAAEASLMANLYEKKGKKYGEGANGLYSYVRNSGWFANAAHFMDNGSASKEQIDIVRKVLVEGYRTVPIYVDEHDCFDDISSATNNGTPISVRDRSQYKQGVTICKNSMGSTYTFYCFPDKSCDPFGYKNKNGSDFCYNFDGKNFASNGQPITSTTSSDDGSEQQQQQTASNPGLVGMLANTRAGKALSAITGLITGSTTSTADTGSGDQTGGDSTPSTGVSGSDGSVSKLISVAQNEVGYHEKNSNANLDQKTASNDGSGNYTKYMKEISPSTNPEAWCAAFVSWCARHAGIGKDEIPNYIGCSDGWSKIGNKVSNSNVKPGDLLFKSNNHHTGIVKGKDDKYIYTIEGNHSDKVAEVKHSISDTNWKYARPKYKNNDAQNLVGSANAENGNVNYKTRGGNKNKPLSKLGIYGMGKGPVTYVKDADGNRYGIENTKDIKSKDALGSFKSYKNSIYNSKTSRFGRATTTNETIKQQTSKMINSVTTTGVQNNNNETINYTGFIKTIVEILCTIADNTDKLNIIVNLLNEKLGTNISSSEMANYNSNKESMKSKLKKALLNQQNGQQISQQFGNQDGISAIINAMNAIAME